jgi:tRNA pseudouridine32 synthase / 23S rRNA pseudouridine746 synthase
MIEPHVIWQDDALLVVDKPAGLLSIPDGYRQETPYLLSVLAPEYPRLWVVHRLDRETSGVIVLARSAEAHHRLNDQFAGRKVRKVYHAVVLGIPVWDEILVDEPLRKNGDRSHRTVIDRVRGKPASTSLRTLERFPANALIEAQPHSGYTHQIRTHLAWAGFPLAGDPLYAPRLSTPGDRQQNTAPDASGAVLQIDRVALHALQITFLHPITGQEMTFSAPYPRDFSAALDWLREDQARSRAGRRGGSSPAARPG